MGEKMSRTRSGNANRIKKLTAFLVVFAMAVLLASCAQETGGNSKSNAPASSGTTTEGAAMGGATMGTTGGTTMSGTTMSGTTMGGAAMMGGGTTGGTTMSGTTSGGTTMSTTSGEITSGTTSGSTSAGSTLTSVRSIVSETDKTSLVGRPVDLKDAKVRSSIGNAGFLAGSSGADQVLVVPGGTSNVQQGQTATIGGTLRKMPGISAAQQQFGISKTEAALLQSQVVYLDAEQVQ